MRDAPRRAVLLLALLAAGAAAYFAPPAPQPVDAVQPKPRTDSRSPASDVRLASASSAMVDTQVLPVRPRDESGRRGRFDDLFATPVPKAMPASSGPVPASPAPAPPEPPPVAMKVLGQYTEEGRPGLFIEYKEQNLIAHVGDTIGGLYRIESIQDGRVTVRYLPLDRPQFVDLSEPSTK